VKTRAALAKKKVKWKLIKTDPEKRKLMNNFRWIRWLSKQGIGEKIFVDRKSKIAEQWRSVNYKF
jgi:hypothetical protein